MPKKYVFLLYKLYFKRVGKKTRRLIRSYYRNSGRTEKTIRLGDLSCIQNSLHILPTSLVLLSFLTQIRFHPFGKRRYRTSYRFPFPASCSCVPLCPAAYIFKALLLYHICNAGSSSFLPDSAFLFPVIVTTSNAYFPVRR